MRQGSLQRGGSILKKGVVVDRRTLYPREKLLLALLTEGGTIDCLVTWGEKTLHKDGSLEVLVPSRSL